MRQKHILNIGYPKSGTTWVWENLLYLDGFRAPHDKENLALKHGQSIQEYIDSYVDYDITANFDVSMFYADRYIIQQLSTFPQIDVSIIFRNPFEIFWSHYNYLKIDMPFNEFAGLLVSEGWFTDMSKIVQRWRQYFGEKRVNLFFYEDLVADRLEFFRVYCRTMGLPEPRTLTYMGVNVTKYYQQAQMLDQWIVDQTNQHIIGLQELSGRNLGHWLR